jgi:hypothetical protein
MSAEGRRKGRKRKKFLTFNLNSSNDVSPFGSTPAQRRVFLLLCRGTGVPIANPEERVMPFQAGRSRNRASLFRQSYADAFVCEGDERLGSPQSSVPLAIGRCPRTHSTARRRIDCRFIVVSNEPSRYGCSSAPAWKRSCILSDLRRAQNEPERKGVPGPLWSDDRCAVMRSPRAKRTRERKVILGRPSWSVPLERRHEGWRPACEPEPASSCIVGPMASP